jgi:uncharacterized protein (DUF58 family)
LLLFTDDVEKFIPPRKGRGHVLRVIREVLYFEPKRRGTDLAHALEFMGRVLPHKAIAVVISDFLECGDASPLSSRRHVASSQSADMSAQSKFGVLPQPVQTALRMANRRHDVVAVHIADRYELELPTLGRLILEDAETGEIVELNTAHAASRDAFALRQEKNYAEVARQLRSSGIDSIQLRTDEPYAAALGRFFEAREKRRLRG